jgi:hypothetical protein
LIQTDRAAIASTFVMTRADGMSFVTDHSRVCHRDDTLFQLEFFAGTAFAG